MDRERWQRLEELFHRATNLDPAERAAFLERECAGDEALLGPLRRLLEEDAREVDLVGQLGVVPRPAFAPMVGREIGVYRLTSLIAAGGMGMVYKAVRTDGLFQQAVAVKLIRAETATEATLKRFEFERRTLASLQHPNIAHLYDGGTTEDGIPYLVMEFLEGLPIDQYCNLHRLPLRERLRLFLDVCRAVHFAHQNLIVHRDLKPGNILVDHHGTCKLLDFGIARLIEGEEGEAPAATHTLARVMTPEFASPEQLRGGHITTGTDVYSLGVVLYLLLTGRKPFDSGSHSVGEWERIVSERPPSRPSSVIDRQGLPESSASGACSGEFAELCGTTRAKLKRWLMGDLDRVVLMALRKEPERRYASVQQFAEDIERHLSGQTVIAREDSVLYRAGKFVQRNRLAVGSALLLMLSILGALVLTLSAQSRIEQEALHGRIEADSFRTNADFLMDAFLTSHSFSDAGERDLARQRILLQADQVRRQYPRDRHLRANLLDALGKLCVRLDLFPEADALIHEALQIRIEEFGDVSLEVALSYGSLGRLAYQRGDFEAAAGSFERALRLHRTCDQGVHTNVATAANDLAVALRNLGRLEAAQRLHEEAVALRRETGNKSLQVAESLNNLAGVHLDRQQFGPAFDLLAESLKIRREILGDHHPLTLQSFSNLSIAAWHQGDPDSARRYLQEAEAGYRQLRADGVEALGRTLSNLAALYIQEGELDRADQALDESLALLREGLGPGHPRVITALSKLAQLRHRQGRDAEARSTWLDAISTCRAARGAGDPSVGNLLRGYCLFLLDAGAPEEAESVAREAVEIQSRLDAKNATPLAQAEVALGLCLRNQGRLDAARLELSRAVLRLEEHLGEAAAETLEARRHLEALDGMISGASAPDEAH